MGEMQTNLSNQLSQSLALQTANYLQAVWEVTGPQKKEMAAVVEARKLDYELLDRWIKYMAKPTEKYKNKDAWQAMMKTSRRQCGGMRRSSPTSFRKKWSRVMLARNELTEENKVIADKAMDGTKKKKRTNKPSNFVTNEDFCPGCALRLKGLPEDQNFFWTEIFQREVERQRRSERDDGHGPAGQARSAAVPRLGTGKPGGRRSTGAAHRHAHRHRSRAQEAGALLSLHSRCEGSARNQGPSASHSRQSGESRRYPLPRHFLSVLSHR